jgi:hypothetical protein
VTAKIEHAQVVSTRDARGHEVKRPLIIYSYAVGGVRYTTDRITSLRRNHSDAWAADMVRRYHVGENVTAYSSPTDPGSAFLIAETDWRLYGFIIAPLVLAIALAVYWPWAMGSRAVKSGTGS